MGSSQLYRPTGLVLARVTTYPGDVELPELLDSGEPADPAWLDRIWARPDVRAAIMVASPALHQQISSIHAGSDPAHWARAGIAVASYLLRWQRRPVPFGVFAGVTPAQIGAAAAAVGSAHRVVVRADGQWLSALVDRLETHPAVLSHVRVTANSTVMVRGERVVIPARPSDGADPGPAKETSIRNVPPVRAALAAAATPIPFRSLADHLAAAFPDAPAGTITTTLTALVQQGFLLTSLRPPFTVVDGLPYLIDQLREAAGDLPDLAATLATLTDIHRGLARHHTIADLATAAPLTARMRALCTVSEHPLAADTAADAAITLPRVVLNEAASAASVLLRLTSRPFGAEVWRDFHVRFRAQYGAGALVPVRDLLADSGLGLPAGFLGASHGRPAHAMPERDAKLLALIQEAAIDGRDEIALTEQTIRSLTVAADSDEMILPPRVELGFEVRADSADEVDRGRFELWVNATPRPQSSMAGRFAHLLPEPDLARLVASYQLPDEHAVAAQVSFPPRLRSSENVVRAPRLLPAVIPLAEHPAPGTPVIGLEDLAVTADATQMHLVQLSTGRRVVPRALHALEASIFMPALARFLTGVATARHAIYGPIDFGAGNTLPYLPRVRHGRTVLSPARWILAASALARRDEALPVWEKTLDAWRDRWRVPSLVVLHQDGQRLTLDLDARLDRALLRRSLNRASRVELREAPTGGGWVGRACEFLVTLATAPSASRPLRLPPAVRRPAATVMPGAGHLIHARLAGHPDRYDEILTTYLPRLLEAVDVAGWWFRRYRDTLRADSIQQLWLYLRLTSPAGYGPVAARLAGFGTDLQERGLLASLTLAPYRPQTGRYGHGRAMAAAHDVAAADSAAVLAQITMAARTGIPGQAIAAASMTDLAAALAPTPAEGCRWLLDVLPQEHGALDRAVRDATLGLADDPELRRHPGGAATAAAWAARATMLGAYRAALSGQRDPATVLRTLLHDHHVRALGVSPSTERVTNRLARAAALRHLALTERTPQP